MRIFQKITVRVRVHTHSHTSEDAQEQKGSRADKKGYHADTIGKGRYTYVQNELVMYICT